MIEYRTERIDPSAEDNVTNILSTFGWAPVNSQEVYNESTELLGVEVKTYGDGLVGGFMSGFTGNDGKINVRQRKNITNYTVIKFARDTEMPNYERLRELNEEFEERLKIAEPKKPIVRTAIAGIGILIIIISVIMAIVGSNSVALWEILVCVLFPVIMIPITVVSWVFYKRKLDRYDLAQIQLYQIYSEAQEIAG